MPPKRNNQPPLALFAAALLAGAAFGRATNAPISYEAETEASYVGSAQLNRDKGNTGSIDEAETRAHVVLSLPIRDELLLRLGVDWQRKSYELPEHSMLPNTLQSLALIVGADFQVAQTWLVRFEAQPGYYNTGRDLRWAGVNVPMILGVSYFVSADLQLVAGVSFDAERKYSFLPGAGLRWKFAERWVFDGILPAPRLEFTASKALMLYAGANLREDTYRVPSDFGLVQGDVKLNGAVLDDFELRIGAGASWEAAKGVHVEIETGAVPVHEFDFHRADIRRRIVEPAAYVDLSIKAEF